MGYFITNLSLNVLVKEFLESVNIWHLHFCPQRCRTRQISKITCVLRTETVLIVGMLIGRLMLAYYQQILSCCRPVLTY